MFHFIYKTIHKNGKYYIGRHSTNNLDDGYIGSGYWPSSIKDKTTVTREILQYTDNEKDLILLEAKYLATHYGKEGCMNRTADPIGFDSTNNPMKNPTIVEKISGNNHWSKLFPEKFREKIGSENHWMNKDPKRKEEFIKNNPNLDGRNAKMAMKKGTHANLTKNASTINAKNGTHHWQNGNSPNYQGKLNKKLVEEGRHNFLGPELNKQRVDQGTHNFLGSESNLKRLAEGRHPSQKKQTCEHCGKIASVGMYKRWHGNNCKHK